MNSKDIYNLNLKLMATFFIQTDKDFYFAGDTVNGNIFINVGAMIVGAQGLSLKFTGYECVKWQTARELFRPRPPVQRPGQPPPPPPFDPIAAIPPGQLHEMQVKFDICRDCPMYLTASPKVTTTTTIVPVISEQPRTDISRCSTTRLVTCSPAQKQ